MVGLKVGYLSSIQKLGIKVRYQITVPRLGPKVGKMASPAVICSVDSPGDLLKLFLHLPLSLYAHLGWN